MNAGELVLSIERHWGKTIGSHQRATYMGKLARFNPDRLDAIFDRVLETSHWLPSINQLYQIAEELGFSKPIGQLGRGSIGAKGCTLCEGTGWRYVTEVVTMPDGVTFEPGDAVRRCECRRRHEAGSEHPTSSTQPIAKTILQA